MRRRERRRLAQQPLPVSLPKEVPWCLHIRIRRRAELRIAPHTARLKIMLRSSMFLVKPESRSCGRSQTADAP
ncbi:hypothetical protein CBM2587_B60222 [Cupriavidus taiwanensis]|uniref:Uncharacterized protein n=1 Tax=Cupriavidus taiwanensis TaxID=164546 RepID=A0A976A5Z9_9BURK|nr:hypothetical protein CBM2587_B60222 [Cupriavidus taiwanensis]